MFRYPTIILFLSVREVESLTKCYNLTCAAGERDREIKLFKPPSHSKELSCTRVTHVAEPADVQCGDSPDQERPSS